jgi:hypothetical protein
VGDNRRNEREKQKGRRNIHKGIHSKNKSTAKTNPRQKQKGFHGKNRKVSTVKTKTNPRQKQKDSTQNKKERRAVRA